MQSTAKPLRNISRQWVSWKCKRVTQTILMQQRRRSIDNEQETPTLRHVNTYQQYSQRQTSSSMSSSKHTRPDSLSHLLTHALVTCLEQLTVDRCEQCDSESRHDGFRQVLDDFHTRLRHNGLVASHTNSHHKRSQVRLFSKIPTVTNIFRVISNKLSIIIDCSSTVHKTL